jgi:hypothetical protein
MLFIIDEVVGTMVHVTNVGECNPESVLNELIPSITLVAQCHMCVQTATLLEQTRLVYANYDSASIRFVLPILPLLQNVLGEGNVIRIRKIETIVETAPYISRLTPAYETEKEHRSLCE